MEKLLASIATRLKYIRNNSKNNFILKSCDIIDMKLDEIRAKKYTSISIVTDICDKIVNYDISRMKRVAGETDMVYKKMDELAGFIAEIKEKYFE